MVPKIGFSTHVLDRYIERVKPHLDHAGARAELRSLVAMAPAVQAERPGFAPSSSRPGDERYIVVSDGIALSLTPKSGQDVFVATTVLTRETLSADKLRARRVRRSKRYRQWATTRIGRGNRRPDPDRHREVANG